MSTVKNDTAPEEGVDRLASFKERVRKRLKELRISEREASRRAGFHVGYVNDLLKGRYNTAEADRILALAATLEIPEDDIFDSSGDSPSAPRAFAQPQRSVAIGMLPLYALSTASQAPWVQFPWKPAGFIPTISSLEFIEAAYAVTVFNDASAPRYLTGETIYVSPAAPVRSGDFSFIRQTNGTAAICRIKEVTDSHVIAQFVGLTGGDSEKTVRLTDIETMHRIVASLG